MNTVVHLYVATLTRGHLSYEATILENTLCIIAFNIPLMRGHPSNTARFSIAQGWPYKRGTTVYNKKYNMIIAKTLMQLGSKNKKHLRGST